MGKSDHGTTYTYTSSPLSKPCTCPIAAYMGTSLIRNSPLASGPPKDPRHIPTVGS